METQRPYLVNLINDGCYTTNIVYASSKYHALEKAMETYKEYEHFYCVGVARSRTGPTNHEVINKALTW